MNIIGIDTGVDTGVAVWSTAAEAFVLVHTMNMVGAQAYVLEMHRIAADGIFVRFEDARLRNWFGNSGRERWQGAGSVKRDGKAWQEFLDYYGIPYERVAPAKNKTKLNASAFRQITGWKGSTSEHSRDAGMLVFKFNPKPMKLWMPNTKK